jgi:hypothetical protein
MFMPPLRREGLWKPNIKSGNALSPLKGWSLQKSGRVPHNYMSLISHKSVLDTRKLGHKVGPSTTRHWVQKAVSLFFVWLNCRPRSVHINRVGMRGGGEGHQLLMSNIYRVRILKHSMEAEKSTFEGELSFHRSECTAGLTVATNFLCCF